MKRTVRWLLPVSLLLLVGAWFALRGRSAPSSGPAPAAVSAATPDAGAALKQVQWHAASRDGGVVGAARGGKAKEDPVVAWGSGPGQLGRTRPKEGNPEGPLSLTIGSDGTLFVLDQVNARIARFDAKGAPLEPWPMTQQTPKEIVALPGGGVATLDPYRDRSVSVIGPDGRVKGEAPIQGAHFEDPALATSVFADEKGVYVEKSHGELVRVADTDGKPVAERATLDGRPSRDGQVLLSAAIIDSDKGTLWVRAMDAKSGEFRWQKRYTVPEGVLAISFLDSDRAGRIAVAAHTLKQTVAVLCLNARGEPRDLVTLPASTLPEESMRELAMGDDGALVYLHRTEAGIAPMRFTCGG